MRVVIVGGGQAAASVAATLRKREFSGEILMLCQEDCLPYERPPLSKKYLLPSRANERKTIFPDAYWPAHEITAKLSCTVTGIDPIRKITKSDHGSIGYDHLVLATGSSPRRLPERMKGNLGDLCYLRSLEDAGQLRRRLARSNSLILIGGGYIGLELAATARTMGLDVTVVERDVHILNRVASTSLAGTVRNWHQHHGVRLLERTEIKAFTDDHGVTGVLLANGEKLTSDCIAVGIGAVPNTALAFNAGLQINNGIAVDAFGQTSTPGIWAAGDCASFPYFERRIRLESIQNAIDQGEAVAENILGSQREYVPLPTFWSDQFDHTIQIAGLIEPGMKAVIRDAPSGRSYWHYRDGLLQAVEVTDDPKSYSIGRRMLSERLSPSSEAISDGNRNLKDILKTCREPVMA